MSMDSAPMAMLFSRDAVLREADSARPWAPVVEPRGRRHHAPRWRRLRLAMAAGLQRTAAAIAPAPAQDLRGLTS